jgi:hypothetical protein
VHVLAALAAAGALGVAALPGPALDPAQLSLPRQGLVVAGAGGLVLRDLRGRVLGHLRGFRVVPLYGSRPRGEVAVARGGATFALGANGLRRFPLPRRDWPSSARGCHPGPRPYVICGVPYADRRSASTVYLRGRKLLGPAGRVGHWRSVVRSPDGRTLLLQWSAECESPVAYLADANGRRLRRVAGSATVESVALGWAGDGRAVVVFPRGVCGATHARPGTYLVEPSSRRLVWVFGGSGELWG